MFLAGFSDIVGWQHLYSLETMDMEEGGIPQTTLQMIKSNKKTNMCLSPKYI